MENRIFRLREFLKQQNCDGVIINKEENLHYFSGFTGDDTILIITSNDCYLITDSRYIEQAKQQTDFAIFEQKTGLLSKTAQMVEELGLKRVAFEGNSLRYNAYAKLNNLLQGKDIDFSLYICRSFNKDKVRNNDYRKAKEATCSAGILAPVRLGYLPLLPVGIRPRYLRCIK